MSKKYKLIFGASLLAFVAIIVGVCFVFFGNKAVKSVPESLSVNNFDGEYYLTAQANPNYEYSFKLEQLIDDDYVLVDTVSNKTNSIKLSDQKINLVAGNEFRFSVCYMSESGDKGNYSDSLTWVVTKKLAKIDESSFVLNEKILSWDEIVFAEKYKIMIVNSTTGVVTNLESTTNNVDLSGLAVGNYTAFVSAENESEFIQNSAFSEGFVFEI